MSHGNYRPFDLSTPLPGFAPPSCSRGVATTVAADDGLPGWGEGADFRRFQRERAAGVATVAGVAAPRLPWAAGMEQLRAMPCPTWLATEQWERLVFISVELSRTWGAQAHALGWTEVDLFGCHTQPWKGRIDHDGLALSLAQWRGPIRVVSSPHRVVRVDS